MPTQQFIERRSRIAGMSGLVTCIGERLSVLLILAPGVDLKDRRAPEFRRQIGRNQRVMRLVAADREQVSEAVQINDGAR